VKPTYNLALNRKCGWCFDKNQMYQSVVLNEIRRGVGQAGWLCCRTNPDGNKWLNEVTLTFVFVSGSCDRVSLT